MTRKDQKKFVKELIKSVQENVLKVLPKVPEEWDGHELRQLIADHFARTSFTLHEMKKRHRIYKNAVIILNLT